MRMPSLLLLLAALAGGSLTTTAAIGDSIPTLEKLEYLPVASPARPDPAMIYAGDELKINIVGGIDNTSKAPGPAGCTYQTAIVPDLLELKALQPPRTTLGGIFGVSDLGRAPGPGSYHVVVKGMQVAGSPAPPCHGEVSIPMYFWPQRAFIDGLSLRGSGLRVGNNDETSLMVIPKFGGSDPGGSCGYHISYTVKGATTDYEEVYHDGGAPEPTGAIPSVNDNNVTFVVTLSAARTAGVTSCQIWPNATITKKITFSANPVLPPAIVN